MWDRSPSPVKTSRCSACVPAPTSRSSAGSSCCARRVPHGGPRGRTRSTARRRIHGADASVARDCRGYRRGGTGPGGRPHAGRCGAPRTRMSIRLSAWMRFAAHSTTSRHGESFSPRMVKCRSRLPRLAHCVRPAPSSRASCAPPTATPPRGPRIASTVAHGFARARTEWTSATAAPIAMSLNGRSGWLGELTTAPKGSELVMNEGPRALVVDARHPRRRGEIVADGRATFVVDSVPRAALAFARWRNGEMSRVVAAGTPPIVRPLGQFARARLSARVDSPERTRGAHARAEPYQLDPARPRQCVHRGSPVRGDARQPGARRHTRARVACRFERACRRVCSARRQLPQSSRRVRDQTDHRVGGVGALSVPPDARRRSSAGTLPIGGRLATSRRRDSLALPRLSNGESPSRGAGVAFCRRPTTCSRSRSASSARPSPTGDGLPAMETGSVGPGFSIAGRHVAGRPKFRVVDGVRRLDDSPLARGLSDLFDAEIGRTVGRYDTTLWTPLTSRGWLKLNGAWQRVSPEVPQLPLDDPAFRDLHRLAGFMIGETDNSWSNIALARAVSRHLHRPRSATASCPSCRERGHGTDGKAGRALWPGTHAVLDGMSGVVRGYGTAHTLAASLPARAGTGLSARRGRSTLRDCARCRRSCSRRRAPARRSCARWRA